MSQPQGYGRENCILLAVLCGQFADRRRGDAKNRPQYPFPELVSSGRLEVTSSSHVFVPFVFHKVWGVLVLGMDCWLKKLLFFSLNAGPDTH